MARKRSWKSGLSKDRTPTLAQYLQKRQSRPKTGVTQGGSSRQNRPAVVAATNGQQRARRK